MCGINGFNFVDKNTLKEMNDSLVHRGPDASGEFFDGENFGIIIITDEGEISLTIGEDIRFGKCVDCGKLTAYRQCSAFGDWICKKCYNGG